MDRNEKRLKPAYNKVFIDLQNKNGSEHPPIRFYLFFHTLSLFLVLSLSTISVNNINL